MTTATKFNLAVLLLVVVLSVATGLIPIPRGEPDDGKRLATAWLDWSGAIAGLKVYWQFGGKGDWSTSSDDDTRPFEVHAKVRRGDLVTITARADNDLQAPYACVVKLNHVDIPGSARQVPVGRGITCSATVKW